MKSCIRKEHYFGIKPVLIGYDRHFCGYLDIEFRVRTFYFLFLYYTEYKLTIYNK